MLRSKHSVCLLPRPHEVVDLLEMRLACNAVRHDLSQCTAFTLELAIFSHCLAGILHPTVSDNVEKLDLVPSCHHLLVHLGLAYDLTLLTSSSDCQAVEILLLRLPVPEL